MKAKVTRNDGQHDKSNASTRKDTPATQAAQFADTSARTSDQASLMDSIQNSPRAAAQAAQFKTVFGEAAQLEPVDSGHTGTSATEEDPAGHTGMSATDDATSTAAVSATDTATSSNASPAPSMENENESENDNESSATEDDAAGYTGATA